MSAISELLEQIRTAIYGKQVRGAIHDSIEQCYDDVTAGATLADAAAVRATETADRMDALLDDLPDSYQDLVEEVDKLKSEMDNNNLAIAQLEATDSTTQTVTNNYYMTVPVFDTSKPYRIDVTIGAAGNYTLQTSTSESSSSVVDTLANNVPFAANEPKNFTYKPSASGITKLRLSSNSVSWSATIAELINVGDVADDVAEHGTQIETMSKTANSTNEFLFSEQKRTPQLLNKFYLDRGKLYIRTSDRVLRDQEYCVSATVPYSVTAGDRFALYASGNYSSIYENIKALRIATSSVKPAANGTVNEHSTQAAVDSTHVSTQLTTTVDANYLMVSVVFASSTTADDANAMFDVLLQTMTLCKLDNGYPQTYIPYYLVDVKEANLSDDLAAKVNRPTKVDGYGVKWSLTDADDLGTRCFRSDGLSASIGIGATDGASDFDAIYPWSEIKRCNIKANANGAYVVTYEGETGFALDGSNGDVFVRIPKFNVLRYRDNGYEYRIIGVPGSPVHEAFVENGKELEEIFVGAFEASTDNNSKLRSIAGVIPTSNVTAATFLTRATANGDNYSLYDLRCVDAIWTLMAVEFGCRNTNQIIGYGLADFLQPTAVQGPVTVDANNTNTIRVNVSDSKVYEIPVGSNLTICQNANQLDILAQRKITAVTKIESGVYDITIDGDPVNVTAYDGTVTPKVGCFVGTAAFSTGWASSSPSGALNWHTGRNNWVADSNTQNAVRYRWIENPVGNLWAFLPDVTFYNLQMYVCKSMEDYEFFAHTGAYKPFGPVLIANDDNGEKTDIPDANYWITSLLDDTFAKAALFGSAYDKSLTSGKAFGGYYYLKTGTKIIANGGGFDHLYRCNMLTNRAWIQDGDTTNSSRWYLYGARLMFKKIV